MLSRTLPLGSTARVTNKKTGLSTKVKITDRGPFVKGRSIDLSKAAAKSINMDPNGVAPVVVDSIKPEEQSKLMISDEQVATTVNKEVVEVVEPFAVGGRGGAGREIDGPAGQEGLVGLADAVAVEIVPLPAADGAAPVRSRRRQDRRDRAVRSPRGDRGRWHRNRNRRRAVVCLLSDGVPAAWIGALKESVAR